MSLRFSEWRLSLLTSLGLGAALGCGGATTPDLFEEGGTAGAGSGGAHQGGSTSGGALTSTAGKAGSRAQGGSTARAGQGNVPVAGKSGGGAGKTGGGAGGSNSGGSNSGGSNSGGSNSGGSSPGGATSAGAAQGGSSGGSTQAPQCKNPRTYPTSSVSRAASGADAALVAPVDPRPLTGFIQCDSGWLHRSAKTKCPSSLPRNIAFEPPVSAGACTSDADCTARPHGYCAVEGQSSEPFCNYGCTEDSECSDGMICLCGDPVGRCVVAHCELDSDCESGVCAGTPEDTGCGVSYAFACTSPKDACMTGTDCGAGQRCAIEEGGRQCRPSAVCGRPYLVDGNALTAPAECADNGWSASLLPDQRALDANLRAKLAAYYTELGLMEHASVAAFARFILELLAFAAPADLVRDAQRALGDEIAHAELCFGLATAYAESPVSAGALPANSALDGRTRSEVVRTAILEACIGETIAAVEARFALDAARDPEVRRVLTRIAADEARHAELGWRFVHWVLRSSDAEFMNEVRSTLQSLVEREALDHATHAWVESDDDERLVAHGRVSLDMRARARALAFSELILPWTDALLAVPLAA